MSMYMAVANSNKVDIKTLMEWLFKLLTIIILPLLIWNVTLLIQLDKRVSIMEGNRLTAVDGIQIREDISTIQIDSGKLENRVETLEKCQIKLRIGPGREC